MGRPSEACGMATGHGYAICVFLKELNQFVYEID